MVVELVVLSVLSVVVSELDVVEESRVEVVQEEILDTVDIKVTSFFTNIYLPNYLM